MSACLEKEEDKETGFPFSVSGCLSGTHVCGAPLLHHGDDVGELHLQGESRLPLWLHLYVLAHLPHHRVHALTHTHTHTHSHHQPPTQQRQEQNDPMPDMGGGGVRRGWCTCMHLSSSRKVSRPSRNFSLSWSLHSLGRLIRTYLDRHTHTHTHKRQKRHR